MIRISTIFLNMILFSLSYALSTGPTVYQPITTINRQLVEEGQFSKIENNDTLDISSTTVIPKESSEITTYKTHYISNPNKLDPNYIPQGNQLDINEFNKKSLQRSNSPFIPRPFSNRTNSYWLDPNFQFGPGSVNDFGGNPNASEILGPYIF